MRGEGCLPIRAELGESRVNTPGCGRLRSRHVAATRVDNWVAEGKRGRDEYYGKQDFRLRSQDASILRFQAAADSLFCHYREQQNGRMFGIVQNRVCGGDPCAANVARDVFHLA